MILNLPSGTVTFLFTDIEGSTQLWEHHPEAMKAALARHDTLLRSAIEANHGQVIKTTGDGLHGVFASAIDGVIAVVAGQHALQDEPWQETGPLRVRMGLHTGEAEMRDGDYYGAALNRAARLMAVGTGGQILVSQATAILVQDRLPLEVSLADLGEHRLKDLVRPEHVFQVRASGLPVDFPPLKSLGTFAHNLPVQLTSFVGREKEMAEIRGLLGSTHLLTLAGPGGTGKTRMALQVGAEVLSEYADGVWLVELAPLADPSYLVAAVAAVFGLRELPGRSLAAVVTDYLAGKKLLLLVDNCEHMIEACAHLAGDLLGVAPRLQIVSTSREGLGLAGETIYRVPSLSLPAARLVTPEALRQSEAVRLFVERAQAAQPRFVLTAANAAAVAAICQRLDAIPLALELAAARVKLLSVEQIAARLDDRFRLLVGGSRTALARQQTLRALIDWSYDLLPAEESKLLRQLSVFAGGWTLEAAEAVGEGLDVLEWLGQLVNKSLVLVDDQGAEVRYRLLETIRQYAREKLLEAGEAESVRSRHLSFYLNLVGASESRLFGREMISSLNQLELEQDNLRAGLQWALETDPLAALRAAAVLATFWARKASSAEGRGWVQAAMGRLDAALPPAGEAALPYLAAKADALVGEALLNSNQGDNYATRASAEAAIALARQIDAPRTLALALAIAALGCNMSGDLVASRAYAEEGLALSREHGYLFARAMNLSSLMMLASFSHDTELAALHEEALQVARALGNPWMTALTTLDWARWALTNDNLDEAFQGLEQAESLFRQMQDRSFVASCQSEKGHILRVKGQWEQALAAYRQTILVWQELGQLGAVAHQLECFAFIAQAQEQPLRASRLFGAAEALRQVSNSTMIPVEIEEYHRSVAFLRAATEPAAFTSAWAQGHSWSVDDTIAYAIAENSI